MFARSVIQKERMGHMAAPQDLAGFVGQRNIHIQFMRRLTACAALPWTEPVGSSTQPGDPGGWAMLDPSVQAILEGPSVTYIPASALRAAVGSQVVPLPAGGT